MGNEAAQPLAKWALSYARKHPGTVADQTSGLVYLRIDGWLTTFGSVESYSINSQWRTSSVYGRAVVTAFARIEGHPVAVSPVTAGIWVTLTLTLRVEPVK